MAKQPEHPEQPHQTSSNPTDSARALMPVALPILALTGSATVPRKLATTRRRALARALATSAQTLEHDEVDRDVKASPTRHFVEMIPIHKINEELVIWCHDIAFHNLDVTAMHCPSRIAKLVFDVSNARILTMSLHPENMPHIAGQGMAAGAHKEHHACS